MSESSERHRRLADEQGPIAIAIVTISDSRTPETDTNGEYLRERIATSGNRVGAYRLVRDEPERIAGVLDELCDGGEVQAVLLNGGTGISRRDTTYDALHPLLEREIPGFGELFRMLSWEQVGAAAMLSRATAGVRRGVVVFSTPGSPAAVRLAWEKLIEPELAHLVWEVGPRRDAGS